MKTKPTIILFDVGDVLLNWARSSESLASELGVSKDALLDALFTYADDMFVGKISTTDGWAKILTDLHKKADPWDMMLQWRNRKFWFQETLDVLRDLHAAGYQINIMTNSWLGLTEERDKNLLPQELQLVEHIFDSSQAGVKKPDPAFYELVERKLNKHGPDILLVDDSIKNQNPATQLGWQFFHYVTADDQVGATAAKLRAELL